MCVSSDLPGYDPTTLGMILYYRLMTKWSDLGNNMELSQMGLSQAAYILGIKIYRDRLKGLIGSSQDTYIHKVLKRFNIEEANKGFLPMSHRIHLSKTQCPSTTDKQERMSRIPYALAIGSIM
jgi:hypothetical protein